METSHETKKNLRKDKINRIIENYLKEKFSNYNPFWLNTPENYQPLADAIDFFMTWMMKILLSPLLAAKIRQPGKHISLILPNWLRCLTSL